MPIIAIVPARYASVRFPGKPLAAETGKFLIQHVCERVAASRHIERCIVATNDARIVDAVESFGGDALLTRADHASGSDRVAEVAGRLQLDDDDIIVNVQGDEPEIEPAALDQLVVRAIADGDCPATTLAAPFTDDADPADPSMVKVVCDQDGHALYFSRALVPHQRDAGDPVAERLLHLGVYAYRRGFLLEYAGWPPSPLEQSEKLEQLRILEHGFRMAVERVPHAFAGIDTPADYAAFVARQQAGKGVAS